MTREKIDSSLLPPVTTPEGMGALRQILIDFDKRLSRIELVMYGIGVLLMAVGTKDYIVALLAKLAQSAMAGGS